MWLVIVADIDDCEKAVCLFGASCVDGVNSYICICAAGFTGTSCETGACDSVCAGLEWS